MLANEMPRLSLRLVDLPATLAANDRARQIAAELSASGTEDEIVWTPEGRHVLRVRRGLPPRLADPSDVLTLGSRHPGGLDSLGWEVGAPRPVGPGQVEVEVHAAGLNFRDMMWAMGLLPEEALIDGFAGPTFGLECAGIVRSIGSDVEGWAVGDRVMGFAPASLSTRVVTMADALAPIPPGMSFAAAATIPVTFVTAIYALGHLAKLAPGEHVLIHAAAGGVGLAAIQYAKHRGAVVIATAGSEVKRSFLRLAGADHVLDSRDLGFCNEVREITGGQGVDVVLNSLSGEAMERSLEVLRPFGRFLELGKRDLYLNRRIHLRPLRQNISYFAIDIDQLPMRRPDLARDLLREVSAALAEGAIRPLAHRIFSFGELDDAIPADAVVGAYRQARARAARQCRRAASRAAGDNLAARWNLSRHRRRRGVRFRGGAVAGRARRRLDRADRPPRVGDAGMRREDWRTRSRRCRGPRLSRRCRRPRFLGRRSSRRSGRPSRRCAASCMPRRRSTTVSPRKSRLRGCRRCFGQNSAGRWLSTP